jgi:Second Messenger Oligonucleotide or Dinucleotide Synthetase domain
MGLNNYLEKLSSNLLISFEENEKIKAAIKVLKQFIDDQLTDVLEHFCFGSYTRGTKLTHVVDHHADVDYLIVFNKKDNEEPNDLVKRLVEFVEKNFTPQNIVQTKPTCIVDINGTHLELIPAYKEGKYLINYKIPSKDLVDEIEWIPSIPNEHNNYLVKYDSEHDYYIIPLIRILKYWNIINHFVYSSYLLENELMFQSYPKFEQISDYFFYAVENLSTEGLSEKALQTLNQFKTKVQHIKEEPSQEKALHLLSTILPYI